MKKLASSLLCCLAVMRADFQTSNWRYRRSLAVVKGAETVSINLDRTVYVGSQPNLADVRIVNNGGEAAYVLEKLSGIHENAEVSSTVLNRGINSSDDLEFMVDAGNGHRHNGIRISTRKTNFRQRVSISTSDDQRNWARVRDDGYIFDFFQDGRHVSVLDIGYGDSSRRYVRVTIHGWTDVTAVNQCWVTFKEDRPAVRDLMASLKPEPQQEPKTQSTLYTWDLQTSGIPYDQLSVGVSTLAFQRAAIIEASKDAREWSPLGDGVLSRFGKYESLSLTFRQSHDRYVRLRIYNRDDKPVAVTSAELSVTRTRVKFKSTEAGAYWIYYGNPDAHLPSYDLKAVLDREAPASDAAISMGTEELNPGYRAKPAPVKPWTERHPGLFYAILVFAVVTMAAITIRLLRKVRAETA